MLRVEGKGGGKNGRSRALDPLLECQSDSLGGSLPSVLLSCGAGWAGSRWGRGWHAAVSRECFIIESGRTLTQCYIIAVSL